MASIKNEIDSIFTFVEGTFTNAKVRFQTVPTKLTENMVSLAYVGGSTYSETNFHNRLTREFQFTYFGSTDINCLDKFDQLASKLNSTLVIPLKDSERYLRIAEPFSFSHPFKTESGIYAIVGMLRVELREAVAQPQYQKVAQVGVTTYAGSDASSWEILDGAGTPDNPTDGFTFDDLENGAYIFGKGVK